jgi:hypothetical protein
MNILKDIIFQKKSEYDKVNDKRNNLDLINNLDSYRDINFGALAASDQGQK